MWNSLASAIIKYRLLFIILIGIITVFMGYHMTKIQMSYDFARTVPPEDEDLIYFNAFKEKFGEDGNIIVVGMKDSAIYKLDNFTELRNLSKRIKSIEGVNDVVALPTLKMIVKDTVNKKFNFTDIFPETVSTQEQLDSLLQVARDQKI